MITHFDNAEDMCFPSIDINSYRKEGKEPEGAIGYVGSVNTYQELFLFLSCQFQV